MPQSSSPYTDLTLPSLNQDNSTYGGIIATYFQGLENKLKAISDRINAAGVGDSSTLAQINSDIDGILPDPYSGDYSTVSTWPAYNTELTALGLSPPQTDSEILAFFNGSDITTFLNFLDGKLDDIDTILTVAESDLETAQLTTCHVDRILDSLGTTTTYGTITLTSSANVTDTKDSCYSVFGSPYTRYSYTGSVPSGFTGRTVYANPTTTTSEPGTYYGINGSGVSGTYVFCTEQGKLSVQSNLPMNTTLTWVIYTRYAYPSACTTAELSPPYFS